MSVFSLSLRSVLRKRGRTTLLTAIVFILTVFLFAGWSCKNATIQTQDETRRAIGASFRLEGNEANRHTRTEALSAQIGDGISGSAGGYHQEQMPNGDWLTWVDHSFDTLLLPDIETIAALDGVAEYNIITANTVVNPVNFKRIEDSDVDQSKDQRGVSLRGERDLRQDLEAQKGNLYLIAGKAITPEDHDVCVVAKDLAEQNGLHVGNTISFNDWKNRESSPAIPAVIIGIYESPKGIPPLMAGDSYRSENIIFTDLDFPEKAEGKPDDPLYACATFTVEDVDNYEEMKEKIQGLPIDWTRYDLLDNTGMSNTIAGNFGDLEKMSTILLGLSFVAGIVVICLVFLFWLKGRTHEIGIFLSMGRTKVSILSQLLMEGLLIGVVAFLLATSISGTVSNRIAEYLVDYQATVQAEQEKAEEGMVIASEQESKAKVVGVQADINGKTILVSCTSVLGIITISILISSLRVVMQSPKEILSEMN